MATFMGGKNGISGEGISRSVQYICGRGYFFFFLLQLLHFVLRQQGSTAEVSLLKILRLWLRYMVCQSLEVRIKHIITLIR